MHTQSRTGALPRFRRRTLTPVDIGFGAISHGQNAVPRAFSSDYKASLSFCGCCGRVSPCWVLAAPHRTTVGAAQNLQFRKFPHSAPCSRSLPLPADSLQHVFGSPKRSATPPPLVGAAGRKITSLAYAR